MKIRNENIEQPTDMNGQSIEVLRPTPDMVQSITSGSQTTTFTTKCVVRIVLNGTGYIKFGTDPTATSTDTMLIGESTEYFKVNAGDKISVLDADMNVSIME